MLRKQHGTKANKGWGKSRHLVSQPFKSIETLAYQGQIAARMGIISIWLYATSSWNFTELNLLLRCRDSTSN